MDRGSQNIVINEVLCFMIDRMDTLPSDSITKLCENGFNEADIASARDELYQYTTAEMRSSGRLSAQRRRGANQMSNNLADILLMLHDIDPSTLPIFVARDLKKLPPITLDVVDVSSILRQLNTLKHDVVSLNNRAGTADEERRSILKEVHETKYLSTENTTELGRLSIEVAQVNQTIAEMPTFAKVLKSPPAATHKPVNSSPRRDNAAVASQTNVNDMASSSQHKSGETVGVQPNKADPIKRTQSSPRPLIPAPIRATRDDASNSDNEGFIRVERKRRRRADVPGSSDVTTDQPSQPPKELKAAPQQPRNLKFFVSRLNPDNTERDLSEHLKQKQVNVMEVKALKTRHSGYKSFMFTVTADSNPDQILSSDLWPENILIRKYIVKNRFSPNRNQNGRS